MRSAKGRLRLRESTSNPDVYWMGPGHPLGWVPGTPAYERVRKVLRPMWYVDFKFDLRALREAVRPKSPADRKPLVLLDQAESPDGRYDLCVALVEEDEDTRPAHDAPEAWELVYSLCVARETLTRALAALPDVDCATALVHGPRAPMEILAGGMTVIASTWATCPEAHRRDGGRYYEKGEAHECPARDCAMGRVFGWDWTEPVRWVFCEGIGEQGRSAWIPVPDGAPRTEPREVGTDGAPLVHRFHRDGRP